MTSVLLRSFDSKMLIVPQHNPAKRFCNTRHTLVGPFRSSFPVVNDDINVSIAHYQRKYLMSNSFAVVNIHRRVCALVPVPMRFVNMVSKFAGKAQKSEVMVRTTCISLKVIEFMVPIVQDGA